MAMTPAQTARGTNFVKDVPVQGPTDQGQREAACRHVQNLPSTPGCDSCKEAIPTMRGEQIFLSGAPVAGFGDLGLSGSDVWGALNRDQQTWVMNTLTKLNDIIVANTGTRCSTWGPSITAAGGCFQNWYNANAVPLNPSAIELRTDGVFDNDTLCALLVTAALDPTNFPTGFPDPEGKFCQAKTGMSKGMKIGLAVAGTAAVGGTVVYLATRKKRR